MQSDNHELIRQMIDETLASGTSVGDDRLLREHLGSCASCGDYLDSSSRVIASLAGFSFAMDPALHEKVAVSLRPRAQQLNATPPSRLRWVLISFAAVVLTIGGSFVDLQFGGLIASVFDIKRIQVRQGLLAFWIVPSLCVLLLFPLLPWLSKAGARRKERTV
jgi:predicted anti-sigma-YlaC factor YlaD